jgi:hypothetical protein
MRRRGKGTEKDGCVCGAARWWGRRLFQEADEFT